MMILKKAFKIYKIKNYEIISLNNMMIIFTKKSVKIKESKKKREPLSNPYF